MTGLPYKKQTATVEETELVGAELGKYLLLNNEKNAFIAMYADLGAGKTAFVRGLASVLAPGANVCSPTYTVVNEYGGEDFRLCHFDMYRIENDDDLYSIGFYDYADCVMAVEWSEKIPFALPDEYIRLDITKLGETERLIELRRVSR